jgi:ABC-2 type transport system ATP-binding protein
MDNELLRLNNLSFGYKSDLVIDGLNLTISCGDKLGVLGHNGAGKTTLIKLMAKILIPKSGEVWHSEIINKRIGFMSDALGLYPFLNAKENLELVLLRNNIKPAKEMINNILTSIQIDPNDKKTVEKYSTGMKKKLSLISTLTSNPLLFILDEPFLGIDPVSLKFMIDTINQTSNEENAFVIVNHDLNSIQKTCNKFLIIKDGKISFSSDRQEDIENIEEIYFKYS